MFLVLLVILTVSFSCNAKTCVNPFEETPGGQCIFNPGRIFRVTWDEGQKICRWFNENATLVEFHSYNDFADVKKFLEKQDADCSHWAPDQCPSKQWCDLGLGLDLDLDGLDQICPASTSTSKPEKCIEVEADANLVSNPALIFPAHYEAFLVFGQTERFSCVAPVPLDYGACLATAPSSLNTTLASSAPSGCNAKTCVNPFEETPGGQCIFNPGRIFRVTWDEGQKICRWFNENATLVEFHSYNDFADVKKFLEKQDADCSHWAPGAGPWIGAKEVGNTNNFTWLSNKSPIMDDNWTVGQPNSPTAEDAVMMSCEFGFRFLDKQRDNELPILCQMPPKKQEEAPKPPPFCPASFTRVRNTCYYIGNHPTNWDYAQKNCKALAPNAKLAELETVEEIYAITEFMLKNGNNRYYWIGAEERGSNNEYVWAFSGKPVFVTNWWGSYVPDSRTDDAIHLTHTTTPKYRWNDYPRTTSFYELCEADPEDLS
ncbi:unnamed protein product [Cyprideis torosa]|uniref:Uncharacterized protein n=1 Tax=Cyprideis torosa TaxID=163714 RepID=A0A7R8WJ58_9CRUS|nr:unnamed protein product [Cyprideis torosa]CAG0901594.1 unnamed protein product [Cyprideis torosa]